MPNECTRTSAMLGAISDEKMCENVRLRLFFSPSGLDVVAYFQRKTMLLKERGLRALGLAVFTTVLSGCTLNTDVNGAGGLIKFSGDGQTVAINTALPTQLAVVVVTQFGDRLKNVAVNWSIESGGGSLSSASTLSDDSGIASVGYTSGPTTGVVAIRAQVHGVPALTFHITVS
jgi:hypothetical protein